MDGFSAGLKDWQSFFILSGTASATLLGLLFVALTLRDDIRHQPRHSILRVTAANSFLSLLYVMIYSLYFLIPNQGPKALATEIFLSTLVPLVTTGRAALDMRREGLLDLRAFTWQFLIPFASFLVALAAAVILYRGSGRHIGWFVLVVALGLTIPTRNAWRMLTTDPAET